MARLLYKGLEISPILKKNMTKGQVDRMLDVLANKLEGMDLTDKTSEYILTIFHETLDPDC